MSQEDLTQFLQAVQQDSSLQEKLKAEGADPVAIAREAGFSITQAELLRAHAARIHELSDEELESASGGTTVVACMTGIPIVVAAAAFTFTAC